MMCRPLFIGILAGFAVACSATVPAAPSHVTRAAAEPAPSSAGSAASAKASASPVPAESPRVAPVSAGPSTTTSFKPPHPFLEGASCVAAYEGAIPLPIRPIRWHRSGERIDFYLGLDIRHLDQTKVYGRAGCARFDGDRLMLRAYAFEVEGWNHDAGFDVFVSAPASGIVTVVDEFTGQVIAPIDLAQPGGELPKTDAEPAVVAPSP